LTFIGAAFRSINYQENEEELVILVTPRLVDGIGCDRLPKYLPGQETRSPSDYELFLEGILEAPRGPRDVFVHGHYRPAYLNAPNAGEIPCGNGACGSGACGVGLRASGISQGCIPGGGISPAAPIPAPVISGSAKISEPLPSRITLSAPAPVDRLPEVPTTAPTPPVNTAAPAILTPPPGETPPRSLAILQPPTDGLR
jgi:pilus assembly protein CpaC